VLCRAGGNVTWALNRARSTDRLIDLGIKVRVFAIAVEGLGRKQDRAQDGFAISAMLVQLSDEIADLSEMIIPPHGEH
jgi:hypothetical protein